MSDAQKPRSPKYKWTKELVNIALREGMTQEEIARKCRTQQSVVSSWKNGKNKATEQQLEELIRRYGARLNRTTARVYLVYERPTVTWEQTEIGKRLLELREEPDAGSHHETTTTLVVGQRVSNQEGTTARMVARHPASAPGPDDIEELRRAVYPYAVGVWSVDDLLNEYQESFEETGNTKLVQVEGPIIFRYTFFIPVRREKPKGWEVGRDAVGRWIVHDLQRGKLVLVQQWRRELFGFSQNRCLEQLRNLAHGHWDAPEHTWLECTDDAGRWISVIEKPCSVAELLPWVDAHLRHPERLHGPHDEQVLPFLIRKALIEHGHAVPGIDRITASE